MGDKARQKNKLHTSSRSTRRMKFYGTTYKVLKYLLRNCSFPHFILYFEEKDIKKRDSKKKVKRQH